MPSDSTRGAHNTRGVRPGFSWFLSACLGAAFIALQTIQPVREAVGLDPVIPPLTGTVVTRPPVVAASPNAIPVPLDRRLGGGTRRALRLAPAAQVAPPGTAGRPAVAVQPVVAGQPTRFRTNQRPDSARRTAAALGPVQSAKLDPALRQVVDDNPTGSVRVILRTQPGQHVTMAQWLAAKGREVHRVDPRQSGLSVTLSASDVAALSEDPSVARLSVDAVFPDHGEVGN